VVVSDICGVKALQWLCAIGCVRFARVGGRCAVRSGAWWFFIEIWKLSVISESTTAFCGVFWRYLLVSNVCGLLWRPCVGPSGSSMVFTGDVWPLPVGFVTFRQLCGIFQRGVIVSSEFLVGLWCLTVVFVIFDSSVGFPTEDKGKK